MNENIHKLKVLVADDDRTLRKGIAFELQDQEYEVLEAATSDEAILTLEKHPVELVLSDLKIPEIEDGLRIIEYAKRFDSNIPVLVMTGYGSIEIAVRAMKAGADDFVTKDANIEEIKLKLEKMLRQSKLNRERGRLQEENLRLKKELEEKYQFQNLIGNSKIFRETLGLVAKVAEDSQCTVLLRGESGTGKELIARAIHYNSARKAKPFVVVNISTVPETLLESELFGHVKGAFTNATKDRLGKLKLADGGTLLLDEIGDVSPNLQVKLLRFLQEKTLDPVGSNHTQKVDVRIIAATNQELEKKITEKNFREDLFYRLNVVPVNLPPLRERKSDIPLLVEFFLKKFCEQRRKNLHFDNGVMDVLLEYDWKGNVRELENVIEQLVVLSTGSTISVRHLPTQFRQTPSSQALLHKDMSLAESRTALVEEFEKRFIVEALEKNDWNISKTAKAIEVSREGLHRMVKKYGLKKS